MQLSAQQIKSMSFGVEDFRAYNPAGYAELTERLESARRSYRSAETLQEKSLAQTRIESLERLWQISSELARERFERARDAVAVTFNQAVMRIETSKFPGRVLEGLRTKAGTARSAFAAKQFALAETETSSIEFTLNQPQSRRMSIAMPELPRTIQKQQQPTGVQGKASGTTGAKQPIRMLVDVLEQGRAHEKAGRKADACRSYLKLLQAQPGNPAVLQR